MASEDKFDWQSLDLRISRVFQPYTAIDKEKLFHGRKDQVRAVIDAINHAGRHAILFGGRGVGKTSLGRTLTSKLRAIDPTPIIAPFVTCDSCDDYCSIWRKAFLEIRAITGIGGPDEEDFDPVEDVNTQWKPYEVRRHIEQFTNCGILYVVFDEFDKLERLECRRMMADTLKLFSDHAVAATIIMIGVADNAIGLISDHLSVQRCLAQIEMPRMKRVELEEIVTCGFQQLGMTIDPIAVEKITSLASGLPMYAHLLSVQAGRHAVSQKRLNVDQPDVKVSITKAIAETEATIRDEYEKATYSANKSLYPQVLLACAMAHTDDQGRFAPSDICDPLFRITGSSYTTDRFASHLKHFCDSNRGAVLRMTGEQYRWKYQFTNPLLQPYVIMKGLDSGLITEQVLTRPADDELPLFRQLNR